MQSVVSRLLGGAAALLAVATVQAQSQSQSTTAGIAANQEQLQRERERALRRQQEQLPDIRLPEPEAAPAPPVAEQERPCFPISRISLDGEAAQQFAFALDAVPGGDGAVARCLGSQGISAVISAVQSAIIRRGYVTTLVRAEPQDLKSGELRLSVLPGRVRRIRMADDADPRGTAWNALPLAGGDILNLRDIEQGLENFKRVPTADADIRIVPAADAADGTGVQPGDSDIVISYRQAFPFRLSTSLDDGGSKATGKYQAGATLSYDNWWTLNDLFYLNWTRSLGGYSERGANSHTIHYSIPYGYWTLGATVSGSRYRQQVAGANPEPIVYAGQSENLELKLSRLVYRDAVRKTTVSFKGMLRNLRNFIDDTEVGPQRHQASAWEAGINHREFIGDTVADINLAYRRALDKQGKAPESSIDLPQLVNRYGLWLADASLNTPFQLAGQRLRYLGAIRAQWNRGALPQQDQFSIGGRYTVRGFDGELILQAERGWTVRNELALVLGESGQELYAGVDAGAVGGPSAQYLLGQRLAGAVLGLRGSLGRVSYEAFVATPLVKPAGFRVGGAISGFSIAIAF